MSVILSSNTIVDVAANTTVARVAGNYMITLLTVQIALVTSTGATGNLDIQICSAADIFYSTHPVAPNPGAVNVFNMLLVIPFNNLMLASSQNLNIKTLNYFNVSQIVFAVNIYGEIIL